MDIASIVSEAHRLASSGEEAAAMALAQDLLLRCPGDARVWCLLGHLHRGASDYAQAVSDLTHAIGIDPLDTYLFLDRGADRLMIHDNLGAVEDFSKGLELCEVNGNDYVREALYFWRAEALLGLERTEEALSDLAHVRDDITFWTFKLRTKTELVAECKR